MNALEIVRALNTVKETAAALTQNKDAVDCLTDEDLALGLHYVNILRTRLQDTLKSAGYVSPRVQKIRATKGWKEIAQL